MEVELPSMPVSIRQNYQGKLASSKTGLDKVKKTLVRPTLPQISICSVTDMRQRDIRNEGQRSDLLSGPGYPSDDPYSDDPSSFSSRTRLLQGTETLQDGSRRLDNAQRIALETEDVGADILRNLRGQREQIEHTRDTVRPHLFFAGSLLGRDGHVLGRILTGLVDTSGFLDRQSIRDAQEDDFQVSPPQKLGG